MKKFSHLLTYLFVISFFTSCSTEELSQNTDLIGVWETADLGENVTSTFRLVFGADNTGLKMTSTEYKSGEIVSYASSFNWIETDNRVTLSENDLPHDTYILNLEGRLVLSTSDDIILDKVSDDYSQYY